MLFTKHCEIKKTNKACFAHDATYSDSKDVTKRSISCRILKYRAYKIAINPRNDGYQIRLISVVYKFCNKEPSERK